VEDRGHSCSVAIPEAVLDEARCQHGLISTAQLRALGMTRSGVRSRLQREWRIVLPRVVSVFRGPLDRHQRLIAAVLFAGDGSVIASMTAARWHGVTAADDLRVFVMVPQERAPRSAGFVVVRRTTRPDPASWTRGPLTIASPARSVVDAARECRPDRGRAIVIEAVQRRLVSTAELRHEVEAGAVRGSAAVRAAVQEATAGVWSNPEGDLLQLLVTSRVLPPAWPNPGLTDPQGGRLPTPDLWFDDVGLAVQVHSWRYHSEPAAWDATVTADGVYAEHGIPVVAITPHLITTDPDAVLRRVEAAYRAASVRPRPTVTARPIGAG
jgi:hypothetical protein